MLHFIDMRGTATEARLAVWDTVKDLFLMVNGAQVWDSWDELAQDLDDPLRDRLWPLCPNWALGRPGSAERIKWAQVRADGAQCPRDHIFLRKCKRPQLFLKK